MNRSLIYFSLITILFFTVESSLFFMPSLYNALDQKITAQYLKYHDKVEPSSQISIVDIDAKSIEKYGQWPFSRDKIAQALVNLHNAGAGIIGFDMVFSAPDKLSPHHMAEKLQLKNPTQYPNNDTIFADIISQTPTILGYFFDMQKTNSQKEPLINAKPSVSGIKNLHFFNQGLGVHNNIEPLRSAAYSSATFNLTNITGGIIDKVPLYIVHKDELYPSLSFEMVRIASQSENVELFMDETGVNGVNMSFGFIPTDDSAQIYLNFRGKGYQYPYLSFYDIVNNNFKPEDVAGKFILIGTSDIGLNDLVATQYDASMPGVEVHATAIDNMLNQDFFYKPSNDKAISMLLVFFSTLILGTILFKMPAKYSPFIYLISFGVLLYTNYYFIFTQQIIIGLSAPIITILLTTGIFALVSYYFENLQKNRMHKQFSKKVSASVVDDLLKHDNDSLQVTKQEVSIFFSDIRGFTKLSEEIHDPARLIELLNIYMGDMVKAIDKYKGTVDKFIGDAIMAYWNAPLKMEYHADAAVSSALEQLKQLEQLNHKLLDEFNVTIKIGIGINSGECIVGEMGSSERSDYTIIGDQVNLASRVESLTKFYGVALIITQHTKKLLQDEYLFCELDRVQVQGKNEATTLYEVIAKGSTQLSDELKKYTHALGLYRDSQFEDALKEFQTLFHVNNKKLYEVYIGRIQNYLENPPQNFDGTFKIHSK